MYPWKRFWCPREGRLNLSDHGFLADPEGEHGKILNADVVAFDAISHFPCLALLGEPGIGKTTALDAEQHSLETQTAEKGERLLYRDLGEYGEETRLIQDIFGSGPFTQWLRGDHVLHVFLDSLDECRIHIPQVGKLLVRQLEQVRALLPRLRLRVACRTADWPVVLNDGLPKLWGKDNFGAYELAPLRKNDVKLAAETVGIDPDGFVEELCRAEAVPFAIKPLTLNMLLSVRQREGRLPPRKVDLYEQGCRVLCEEFNRNRWDMRPAGGAGDLSVDQRMAVASRIAAVSMFCARPIVVLEPPAEGTQPWEVSVSALAGGREPVGADWIDVDEAGIRETVGTGLFSARGSGPMGFAHQTYAEFLAARFLVNHPLDATQILSLIRHSADPAGRIVPQLRETAAWVASLREDILKEIAVADPQVLLCADAAGISDDASATAVTCLLNLFETDEASDRDMNLRRAYHKFRHPALADQLRPFIMDKTKPDILRRVAIDIAEACGTDTLQGVLADVALDPSDSMNVRDQAACAVSRIGNAETRQRLRPLAFGGAGEDPRDDLKGWALRALWPELISAEELFSTLTIPRKLYFGSYKWFLTYDLPETLRPEHLLPALRCVLGLARAKQRGHELDRLTDHIVLAGWARLEEPDVLAQMGDIIMALHENYADLVLDRDTREQYKDLLSDQGKRRLLATYIVRHAANFDHIPGYLVHHFPLLVHSDDLPWVLSMLRSSAGVDERRRWAEVARFAWSGNGEHLDLIADAAGQFEELKEEFAAVLGPVELGSKRAIKMKADYEWQLRHEASLRAQQNPPLLDSPPRVRIEDILAHCEAGEVGLWWRVVREMTLEARSTHYGDVLKPDITVFPGWVEADPTLRARIVGAARRYILEGDLRNAEILLERQASQDHVSVYQALSLLRKLKPGFLDRLSAGVWDKWVPVLFGPVWGHKDKGPLQDFVRRAYAVVPDRVIGTFLQKIEKEASKAQVHLDFDPLEQCWDERLCAALLDKARASDQPDVFAQLLVALLEHACPGVLTFAEELLRLPLPDSPPERKKALFAASALLQGGEPFNWGAVWSIVETDEAFGHDLVAKMKDRFDVGIDKISRHLGVDDIASLFLWITRHYPHHEDPEIEGAHAVDTREAIGHFRDGLLSYLQVKGTPEAFSAIERICRELPQLQWLSWVRVAARENLLRNTWTPPSPVELQELVQRSGGRLVQSGEQLLDVICESLGRLEMNLQAETPAAPDLWDQTDRTRGRERFRPKDEDHLSDYVKRHLEDDLMRSGVVALREVRIRRGEGAGQGERTDIHVIGVVTDARTNDRRQVWVIIEVKGCWHREVKTAMETQLVGRYLKDNICQHGLYVVGWFVCPQWNPQDSARRAVPFTSIEDARTFLAEQARDLSRGEVSVKSVVIDASLR